MSTAADGVLAKIILPRVRELLAVAPGYILRVLDVAFSPREYLRKLVLVSLLQLLASTIKRCSRLSVRSLTGATLHDRRAKTYGEWKAAQQQQTAKNDQPLTGEQQLYCSHLGSQAENYMRLQTEEDMYGLMFHLRSELSRSHAGGSGYNRDGYTMFRQHPFALELIGRAQKKIVRALRYVATGSPPPGQSPSTAERLAFINETRLAFGRNALLLSGGAAFGFK